MCSLVHLSAQAIPFTHSGSAADELDEGPGPTTGFSQGKEKLLDKS
jgi:hypothetical protein